MQLVSYMLVTVRSPVNQSLILFALAAFARQMGSALYLILLVLRVAPAGMDNTTLMVYVSALTPRLKSVTQIARLQLVCYPTQALV